MSDTRSQALLEFESASGQENQSFTSPDGRVTLVKSFYVTNNDTAPHVAYLFAVRNGMDHGVTLTELTLDPGASGEWQGWIALNPGDLVLVALIGTALAGWVSGAVLAGGNQFPPGGPAELEALPAGLLHQLGLM